jgi:hypothetical protein
MPALKPANCSNYDNLEYYTWGLTAASNILLQLPGCSGFLDEAGPIERGTAVTREVLQFHEGKASPYPSFNTSSTAE